VYVCACVWYFEVLTAEAMFD